MRAFDRRRTHTAPRQRFSLGRTTLGLLLLCSPDSTGKNSSSDARYRDAALVYPPKPGIWRASERILSGQRWIPAIVNPPEVDAVDNTA
jgi:hypothetical protein